ncbi:hypothetical protein N9Y42_10765 [Mariniblastus sp.]|nr:hypothetical protein [Mariniblastus sp.]
MTKPLFALQLLIAVIFFPAFASGQIKIEVSPNPVVGIGNETTFDIVVSSTTGDTFDALSLAFAVGDGGTVTGNPQDADNLLITDFQAGSIFAGTDFVPVITAGGVGESAILIEFNRAPGNSANIAANGVLATITLDTTMADPNRVFVLNTSTQGATSVFDDGAALPVFANPGQLQMSAVILGDCNLNGVVNFDDIAPFITILSTGGFLNQADTNQDDVVDFDDIASFIEILAAPG